MHNKTLIGGILVGGIAVFAYGFETGARFASNNIRTRLEASIPVVATSIAETQMAIVEDGIDFEEVRQRHVDTLSFLRTVFGD